MMDHHPIPVFLASVFYFHLAVERDCSQLSEKPKPCDLKPGESHHALIVASSKHDETKREIIDRLKSDGFNCFFSELVKVIHTATAFYDCLYLYALTQFGQPEQPTMLENIRKSRKHVILISREYIENQEGELDMMIAESITEMNEVKRRVCLIPILIE